MSELLFDFGNSLVFFFSAFLLLEALGINLVPGWAKSYVFVLIAGTLVMVGSRVVV
ncbi:MAG: hypothetical protein HKP40_02460 [Litoreibacter sp.]|nr:hypothetical protein [Litoreibacter sp.]